MNDSRSRQAFILLRIGFVVAPIIAGADKFFNILTDWTQYLAPVFPNLLGMTPEGFMMVIGVVEIAAGVIVAVRPDIGGAIVSAWLIGIIINLLILGAFLDVALRDLGLSIGAAALALLARASREAPAH
jgi:hypothetical protein